MELLGSLLILCGIPFFLAGVIGILRFPDLYTRLHALTKADNMGLGLVVVGLILQAESLAQGVLLLLTWLLVLIASTVGSYLLARQAHRAGNEPWRKP